MSIKTNASGCSVAKVNIEDKFSDLHKPLNALQALSAASHCIYCYDAPCVKACPTSIDIPTFIHQIRTENTPGAAVTILSENIMGGTCARACPTEILCEQACVRNVAEDNPVEIGLLQRFAVDHLMNLNGDHPFKRAQETGKRIAIIGAGPAGLSCAHRAAMLGHSAVIFEAREKSGGLNEYGLAAYKMVDDFAQKEVDFLLDIGGIEVKNGYRLGDNISLEKISAEYDAVFISVGLGATNSLGFENEKLEGVVDAINFIDDLRQADDKSDIKIGNNIIVIGGGNTAIDAAIQAKRLGAESVTLAYRRGEDNMSATAWEVDLARKNDVIVKLWSQPVSIQGDNKVESMTFERTSIENGKIIGTGKLFEVPTDMVLKAIGQKLDTTDVASIDVERGKIIINENYMTNAKGIFAGGDCVNTGEDLTVQAVEDGKQAAHAIDNFLKNV